MGKVWARDVAQLVECLLTTREALTPMSMSHKMGVESLASHTSTVRWRRKGRELKASLGYSEARVLVLFSCCDTNHDQKQLRKGKVISASLSRSLFIMEEVRAGG